jgi:hypothetical protein
MKKTLPYILRAFVVVVCATVPVQSQGGPASVAPRLTATQSASTTPALVVAPSAPATLDANNLSARIEQTLKIANLPVTSIIPTNAIRLTPVAPRHASGAEIKMAGPLFFQGASGSAPHGSYSLKKAILPGVTLRIPTEQNKVYVLDCQVSPQSQVEVQFMHNTASYPGIEDGHAMYAFEASSTMTELSIYFIAPYTVSEGANVGYFYGCDVNEM